jgi:hypothetical protein
MSKPRIKNHLTQENRMENKLFMQAIKYFAIKEENGEPTAILLLNSGELTTVRDKATVNKLRALAAKKLLS